MKTTNINWELNFKLFLNYLQIEKGYSDNTVTSYSFDIKEFLNFSNEKNINLKTIEEYLFF